MPSIGQLDRRLTPRTNTTTSDGVGGQVNAWTDGDPFWANVSQQSGREALSAGVMSSVQSYLVTTRYRTDLTTAMRLYWELRSVTMEIVSVRQPDEQGRNRWTELDCVEIVA